MQTNGTKWSRNASIFLLTCFLLPAGWAAAQSSNAADTSSPRATLNSFINSCNEFNDLIQADRFFDRSSQEHRPVSMRVLDCLDISELAEFERTEISGEAAIYLKEILDRVDIPEDDEIPDEHAVDKDGEQALARWRIPGTRITIARVEEGPQRHEYLFSPGTVKRAKEYFQDMKSRPYRTVGRRTSPGFYDWYFTAPGNPTVARIVDFLPDWFRKQTYEMARWKWIGLFLAILIAISTMWFLYKFYLRFANRYLNEAPIRFFLTIILPIIAMLIPLGFKQFAMDYLTLRGEILYVISFFSNLMMAFCSVVVIFGLSCRVAEVIIASPRINPHGLDAQFIRILARLFSIVVSVVIFVEGGKNLGFDATTLLASAGVGGLAVALAAQDTLKNLFGTIMLLMDKPFRVGERIVFKNYDGNVEEIGLRSTKIRLLTGNLVTLPNSELANTDIENVGRRKYIRRSSVLALPSGTSITSVNRALEIVRKALEEHEGMEPAYPPRVFLRDLNDSSIGIFFMYWYHPPDYWKFLELGEQVNLSIMEQLEAEKIPFAAPALTVEISDNGDLRT